MPRARAFLAFLLAVTWCSAAWHVDLEAVGIMPEHRHHAHDDHDSDHAPGGAYDGHEEVLARDVAKDQVRAGTASVTWLAPLAFAAWLAAAMRPPLAAPPSRRRRLESDPPLARVWQFVQRCAPAAVAPPALG